MADAYSEPVSSVVVVDISGGALLMMLLSVAVVIVFGSMVVLGTACTNRGDSGWSASD